MGLPSISSSAKNALGSTLLGRLLGSSSNETTEDLLPQLRFTPGGEPHTPRAGSPGFQNGHWVIARPKLATPIIYQHARSPASDHSTLGLGATTPPTNTRESARFGAGSNSRGRSSTSHSNAGLTRREDDLRLQDVTVTGGYTGQIQAWEDEEGSQHVQQEGGQPHEDLGFEEHQGKDGEEVAVKGMQPDESRFVDNPEMDNLGPYLQDLYYAVARPRFDVDPICLRRQKENASVAAGALSNALGAVDRSSNQPPQPTDKVGLDHADTLELVARLLIRSLHEENLPEPVKVRMAAALKKTLNFQDVRSRVADVAPSVVAPLVSLLRSGHLSAQKTRESFGAEGHLRGGSNGRQPKSGSRCGPQKRKQLDCSGGLLGEGATAFNPRKESFQHGDKGSLHAAACLRVLALSENLPDMMTSTSAIPALLDGLKSGSPFIKSVCGGCLAGIALTHEEGCYEMVDFGVLPLLLDLVRDENPFLQYTAWSVLAGIMSAREPRRYFIGAGGWTDLEGMLVKKRAKTGSNHLLLVGQENAMKVLLRLCEETEEREVRGPGSSSQTTTTIPSILFISDEDDGSGKHGRVRRNSGSNGRGKLVDTRKRRDLSRSDGGQKTKKKRFLSQEPSAALSPSPQSSASPSELSGGSGRGQEGEESIATPGVAAAAAEFVAREAIFRAILRQMKRGTHTSMGTAAEILKLAWKACSRRQVDLTMPLVLGMLASDVWMLKSAAAEVILHVYIEDEQRLRCAVSGGVEFLLDAVRTKPLQMQAGTLSALLSLCEHPDVPAIVAEAGGLHVLAEYLTTGRDVTTRFVVLTTMKVILVCERPAVEPFLPDMIMAEHVLGASDDIEEFIRAFVEKRKASDYLRVGAKNVCRYTSSDIANYKTTFKQLDVDASGALDERELGQLLKQLKVNSKKRTVKKILLAADKDNSGMIEFDEFLDIMWDIKHAKGSKRGVLFRRAGVVLEGTLSAAKTKLRKGMRSPLRHRTDTSLTRGHDGSSTHETPSADRGSNLHSDRSRTTTDHSNISTKAPVHGLQRRGLIKRPPLQWLQQRPLTAAKRTISAVLARGKEAAFTRFPRLSRRK